MKKINTIFTDEKKVSFKNSYKNGNGNLAQSKSFVQQYEKRTEQESEQDKKENRQENRAFAKLIKKSTRTLYTTKTVFPFVFFTDRIIVDENKVSVIYKNFFFSEQVKSILIEDVARITAETDLFFGTLKITDRNFTQSPIIVRFLKKNAALCIRRIVEGLLVTKKEGIELAKVQDSSLRANLETIGKATE